MTKTSYVKSCFRLFYLMLATWEQCIFSSLGSKLFKPLLFSQCLKFMIQDHQLFCKKCIMKVIIHYHQFVSSVYEYCNTKVFRNSKKLKGTASHNTHKTKTNTLETKIGDCMVHAHGEVMTSSSHHLSDSEFFCFSKTCLPIAKTLQYILQVWQQHGHVHPMDEQSRIIG